MNYLYANLVVGELFKGLLYGFNGALNVCFYYDGQLFNLAFGYLAEEIIKSYLLIRLELLLLCFIFALFNKLSCKLFVLNGVEGVAAGGNAVKTGYLNRNGGACRFNFVSFVVGHNSYFAHCRARNYNIAGMKGSVLHKHSSNGTAAFVKARFNNRAFCHSVGVGFKFFYIRNKGYHFKKGRYIFMGFCGNGHADYVAAPFFRNKPIFRKTFHNSFNICAGFINLVDSYNN